MKQEIIKIINNSELAPASKQAAINLVVNADQVDDKLLEQIDAIFALEMETAKAEAEIYDRALAELNGLEQDLRDAAEIADDMAEAAALQEKIENLQAEIEKQGQAPATDKVTGADAAAKQPQTAGQ